MLSAPALLSTLLLLQTPSPAVPPLAEDPSASSARALTTATAAERAAVTSTRIAQAPEHVAQGVALPPPSREPVSTNATDSEESKNWDVTLGMGLGFVTGNASTMTLNGSATAERKTTDWIYSAQASGGVYGKSRAPTLDGLEAAPERPGALHAALQLRVDRRFNPRLSGYVLGRGETDHVKSVEFRGGGEVGLGLIWWDIKRADNSASFLRTDLALNYARETRFQYHPLRLDLSDVSLGGPRVGATFRYSLTSDVAFGDELSVSPSFLEGPRLLATNQTQLHVRLTHSLAMVTTFLVQHDSRPAAGKLPTDMSLSVSASMTF